MGCLKRCAKAGQLPGVRRGVPALHRAGAGARRRLLPGHAARLALEGRRRLLPRQPGARSYDLVSARAQGHARLNAGGGGVPVSRMQLRRHGGARLAAAQLLGALGGRAASLRRGAQRDAGLVRLLVRLRGLLPGALVRALLHGRLLASRNAPTVPSDTQAPPAPPASTIPMNLEWTIWLYRFVLFHSPMHCQQIVPRTREINLHYQNFARLLTCL